MNLINKVNKKVPTNQSHKSLNRQTDLINKDL